MGKVLQSLGGSDLPVDALLLLRELRPALFDDISCQPGLCWSTHKLAEQCWENCTQHKTCRPGYPLRGEELDIIDGQGAAHYMGSETQNTEKALGDVEGLDKDAESTKTPSSVPEASDESDDYQDKGGAESTKTPTISPSDEFANGSFVRPTTGKTKLDVYTGELPLPKMKDPRVGQHWALPEGLRVGHFVWSDAQCCEIERRVDHLKQLADANHFKPHTVDRTAHRSKYFFGFGYTYGAQIEKKDGELLLPPELVDPIPDWIYEGLIRRLEEKGKVPKGWINSAVINDYKRGGMIVSHIDPPHLFARPIFIASFCATGRLVFGASFTFSQDHRKVMTVKPPRYVVELPRGSLCSMDGFSANGITHGIRPEDLDGRRVSIVLRHCFEDGPRLSASIDRPLPPAQRGAKRSALQDFLINVDDGSPFLLEYLARFCEKFESVSQVRASFRDACTGSGKSDGSEFFKDLGITKLGHQRLFQRWFKSN